MPEEADRLRIPETWRQGAILPPDLLPEGDKGRIALSTGDELPEGQPYRAHLMATVADDIEVGPRNAVEALLLDIGDKLGECEGIEITGTPVVALEGEVTISELNRYARLDDWDDLSRG